VAGMPHQSDTVIEHLGRWDAKMATRHGALSPARPAGLVTVVTTLGQAGLIWLVIAAVLARRGDRCRRAARDGVVAVVLASLSCHLIGGWLPRPRPTADDLPAYQALPVKPTSSSFPSSHTATAAAFITAVARHSPLAGLVIAPLATTMAYSRLRTRAHWPSDVAAGALWGITIGAATGRLRPKRHDRRSPADRSRSHRRRR